ncbi:MAG: hypothetical protein M1824_006407 [Vezdaea acicularis]|nr:MAG: hypothetical protein M1824_006407 [Vezdaea acicularis]
MASAAVSHPPIAHSHSEAGHRQTPVVHNSVPQIPRGPVQASLSFYAPPTDGSKPFNYVEQPPAGEPQHNFGEHTTIVTISDVRGRESHFTLDKNAFETLSNIPESAEKDFTSDESIKKNYYPEVENLILTNVPGARKVFFFDHTIRRQDPKASRNPVLRVHIDQTPASAAERVRIHLPDEAETLLKGRYRIINVWRPLNGPVFSHPLAFADGSSVSDHDLVAIEHRYPDRTGETAGVQHNAKQDWYYWSGMENNERLLLKCFDSDESVGQQGRVPHTAFVDPRTPANAPGRESIEVRALVFG